ncbi:isopentenyl-diphosphate Delta-isomerase [Chitinophaga nivalis]|uniref:Isopentenyl-diphosphate delta-isomerase n=1 Tax=Chitinophaga nivalis TaxID=2991709 RepID=A0ABT3INR9_9BACT|nr:isopentenyl-diphosphate Delta-isomerase [Chitinophaga nivalis]MCW3464677.1 isopentenyl-diphosphate Delta-isomerase [Chitinophaga nivalis]MCW3485632.1 isopentenyl-diphosphate Delta-isomerase [Chitinophaga nivalis]
MKPEVILVNELDEAVGAMEKMEAHLKGILHRAFSVFIVNDAGEMLLQQRALDKYHSGGLWTNACCSHPSPGETTVAAAHRRLQEEMGFDCELREIFSFTYKTVFDNGLTEHEYDHVFLGTYNSAIIPDRTEVHDYRYIPAGLIPDLIAKDPTRFTSWFQRALPMVLPYLRTKSDTSEV